MHLPTIIVQLYLAGFLGILIIHSTIFAYEVQKPVSQKHEFEGNYKIVGTAIFWPVILVLFVLGVVNYLIILGARKCIKFLKK